MLRGLSGEVTVSDKLCPHTRKGLLDGPCYVLPTPDGNALRHLLAPADRPPDPGDHRTRAVHRPCSAGPTLRPETATASRPAAGTAPRDSAGSSSNGPSTTSSRTIGGRCPARSSPVGSAIAAAVRPLIARWPPSSARSPCGGCCTRTSTASSRRSSRWRSASGQFRSVHAGPGRAGGPSGGDVAPGHGAGGAARRSWGAVVGDDLTRGDRRGGDRDGGPPPRGAGRPTSLGWLEQADRSSGGRKPVLAVGRSGLMLPIRGSGLLPRGGHGDGLGLRPPGRRLGTVYLGRMPEPGQGTLSGQLTALIEAVLRSWSGPARGWCISPTVGPTRPVITAGCSGE